MVGAGSRMGVFTKSESYPRVRLCQILNFPYMLSVIMYSVICDLCYIT